MLDEDKKVFGGWWVWILTLVIFTTLVGFGLRYTSVVGERIIFENSYQKSASDKARQSALESELIAVETRLRGGSLTETQRSDLEAQAAGLLFQLNKQD